MWKRAKIPYFPPFLIHGTWWENGKGFHSGGGGKGFPHGFHVESTGNCGRWCFFFFSQTCREVSPAGDLLLPLAAKVGKNAIQTCGLKIRPRYGFLFVIPYTTRSHNTTVVEPYDELTFFLRRYRSCAATVEAESLFVESVSGSGAVAETVLWRNEKGRFA